MIDGDNDEARHDPPEHDLHIDDEAKVSDDLTGDAPRRPNACGEPMNQPNDPHHAVNLIERWLTTTVIRALHAVGLTDGEMATAVGVPLEAVVALRNAMRFPPHLVPALKSGRDRPTLLRAMHGVGCEDAEMAHILHLSVRKVAALRDEYDLAENVVVVPATDARGRHYTRGRSGLDPDDVARWRDR